MSSEWHLIKVKKKPRFVEVHIDADRSPHAWLRGARDVLNLTQEEIGDTLGVSRRTIARYEGGGPIPEEILEDTNKLLQEYHAEDKPEEKKPHSVRKKRW